MFREIENEWKNSKMEREDRTNYTKSVHAELMRVRELTDYVANSIIDRIEINKDEMDIVLNQDYCGIKMRVNENDYEEGPVLITCLGNYEKEETGMVTKIMEFIKDSESLVAFDIGANVGWYTLNMLKRFPNMTVYSFEPSPITYERLQHNLILNDVMDRANPINLGLYKENSQLEFYYDKETSGASSLVDLRGRSTVSKIVVQMEKMDDWVTKNHVDKVDFIKCDVEGSELFVYQGGKEFIAQNKPIIFSEMLRKWSAKFGYTPNDIIRLMEELGYNCFVITDDERLRECHLVDENTVETNYFFLHKEKHVKIINTLKK